MPRIAKRLLLSKKQKEILSRIANSRIAGKCHTVRANIILLCAAGLSNIEISRRVGLESKAVSRWRRRWEINSDNINEAESNCRKEVDLLRFIEGVLCDAPRPGAPPKFTEEQLCQILLVASEKPTDSDIPLSHWSLSSLANELKNRGIVESISTSQLNIFLKSGQYKTTQS